jgi:hypothetical protein
MRTYLRGKFTLLLITCAVVLAIPAIALADTLTVNDVSAGGDVTKVQGTSGTAGAVITATTVTGDANGCNATGSANATLKLTSSDVNRVNFDGAASASQTTSGCGNTVTFNYQVPSNAPLGDATITATASGGKTGSTYTPDSFTVTVIAPTLSDSTAPVITPHIDGTLGDNGWYVSDVAVTWDVVDDESSITSSSGCTPSSVTSDTSGTTFTCSATSAGGESSKSVTIKRDATAPVINDDGTTQSPNDADWFNTAVSNNFSASDVTSGLANSGDASFSKSSSTEGLAVKINSGPVSDLAGNTNAGIDSAAFNIDLTKPDVSVTGVSNGATYTTGNVPTPGCNTTDGLSGVKTHATVSVTGGTGGFGTLTATCSGAVDNADNNQATTTPVSVTYGVSAAFNGFLQPIDGHSVNTGKFGRTYPIKWQLRDSSGALISDTTAQLLLTNMTGGQKAVTCGSFDLSDSDALETATTGGTSLRYDATSDQFIYNYKAPSSGSCYIFAIRNADGLTTQQIDFQFTK